MEAYKLLFSEKRRWTETDDGIKTRTVVVGDLELGQYDNGIMFLTRETLPSGDVQYSAVSPDAGGSWSISRDKFLKAWASASDARRKDFVPVRTGETVYARSVEDLEYMIARNRGLIFLIDGNYLSDDDGTVFDLISGTAIALFEDSDSTGWEAVRTASGAYILSDDSGWC